MKSWTIVAAALVLSAAGFPALAQTPRIQKELEEKLRVEREFNRSSKRRTKGSASCMRKSKSSRGCSIAA